MSLPTAASLFETAFKLSNPDLYDTTEPEKRQAALDAAISFAEDAQDCAILVKDEIARETTLRAVCDPWSSTRKTMVKLVTNIIVGAGSNIDPAVEAWLVDAAGKVLRVVEEEEPSKTTTTAEKKDKKSFFFWSMPWYAVDGFLMLLKFLVQGQMQVMSLASPLLAVGDAGAVHFAFADAGSSSSSEKQSSSPQGPQNNDTYAAGITHVTRAKLFEKVLPLCTHPQEGVRDTAADIVALLLRINAGRIGHFVTSTTTTTTATTQTGGGDAVKEITLEEVEDAVVEYELPTDNNNASSSSSTKTNWWRHAAAEPHLIALGRLALAYRGIGIARLFRFNKHTSSSSTTTSSSSSRGLSEALTSWAESEHASVRFGCAQLFTRCDFFHHHQQQQHNDSRAQHDRRHGISRSSSGGSQLSAADVALSPEEFESRLQLALLHLLVPQQTGASSSSSSSKKIKWTLCETAAIAAGDLLRSYLPPRLVHRYSLVGKKSVQRRQQLDAINHRQPQQQQQRDDCQEDLTTFSVDEAVRVLIGVRAMGSEAEPVFDVRRACAQLLPLLCAYFVSGAPDAKYIIDVLKKASVIFHGSGGDKSGSPDHHTHNHGGKCDGTPQLSGTSSCCIAQNLFWFLIVRTAFEESSFLTQHDVAVLKQLSPHRSSCSRVRLLAAVYGHGLGLDRVGERTGFDDEGDGARNGGHPPPSPADTVLPCDVRWVADWLRLAPENALAHSHLLQYCIRTHLESYVQDLIFTALHDAAHAHAAVFSAALQMSTSSAVFDPESAAGGGGNDNNNNNNGGQFTDANMSLSPWRLLLSVNNTGGFGSAEPTPTTGGPSVATASLAVTPAPFLFALDPRFAPPALEQDGSNELADGSLWIQALIGETSSARRRRGSHLTISVNSALKNVGRWSASSGCGDGDGDDDGDDENNNNNAAAGGGGEDDFNHQHDTRNRIADVARLASVSASLIGEVIYSGKSSATIELASLLRAADATRSVIRVLGTAAILEDIIDHTRAEELLLSLTKPWMQRLDARRCATPSPVLAEKKGATAKKASETNWDESSSESEDEAARMSEGGVSASLMGYSSSVTWEQEVECAHAAFRHVVHVTKQMSHYEPERVRFVKQCVETLKRDHPESCNLLDIF